MSGLLPGDTVLWLDEELMYIYRCICTALKERLDVEF